MLLIKNLINLFIRLKSHSKKTFFVLFASFLLCANASAEIDFQYTFGGSERFDGNNFRIPSGAESWAGFAANLDNTNPFTFPYGGAVSFTASLATGGSADLRFKFEKQSHPNTEPSFYTSWVTVDSVVIISAGGLGLLALKIAIAAFEVNAIVVDIDNEKLSIAKKIGASEVINSKDEGAASKIMEILGGAASTILDFVGSEESVNFGYSLFGINKGGLYVLVGLLGGKFDLPLPLHTFTARTITGTYVGSMKEMKELMDLVREGRIEPVEVETRPASKASDTLADLKAGKIKGLVCLKH